MRFALPNIMVGHIYTSSNTVVIQAGNKNNTYFSSHKQTHFKNQLFPD